MKTSDTRVIERTLHLQSSIEEVWAALTDPAEIARWFSDQAVFSATPGFEGTFTWDQHGAFPVRVEEVSAPHRLVWSWAHTPGEAFAQEGSTRVEWTLTQEDGGGTRLELRESGFTKAEHQKENEGGWTAELAELTHLMEG